MGQEFTLDAAIVKYTKWCPCIEASLIFNVSLQGNDLLNSTYFIGIQNVSELKESPT